MNIKPMHTAFKCPVKGTSKSGGYDIFMPEDGYVEPQAEEGVKIKLGFAAEVPEGHVVKIYPRSGKGVKNGLALNNTVGIIDADYRGEWMVSARIHNGIGLSWKAGDRLFQFVIVPVAAPDLMVVTELNDTARGEGGFGSTGT
jgi:dUTP pyrophosphatase